MSAVLHIKCGINPRYKYFFYIEHTCDRVAMLQLEICKFWAGDLVS